MDLNELDEAVNQNEKHNEVSNADMLASIVIIQGELQKIEKIITENQKINQKSIADIKATLENHDKNISAIPVLTANIISDKINNAASRIDVSTNNIAVAAKALNESNSAFRVLIYAWVASMLIAFIIILYIIL